ncbi:hypothetical protein [Flavobacterium eburneipallidum]|uniref:hypothetical protein n=1 Tax=Flavobacterium eburneipallidum TaxID=3003263 RepID=UPI0022AC3658|nr:hypothetical protein [Flavobacterium eburneipallidum]
MKLKFDIQETIESEIYYGFYDIYILGGHFIEVNSDFYVQIINIETNEEIELTEKSLKARDYKFGKKAIKFYSFQVNNYGKFRISFHNYGDMVVKDSMLEVFPFPFSIPLILTSFLFGKSRKMESIKNIEILIE